MKVVLFIPIKLNNQRFPGKNTMVLDEKPLCNYIFDTVKNIDIINEKYCYCSDNAIVPYLPNEIKFLQRNKKLDGFEVKGLDIIKSFTEEIDADIYILIHVTAPFMKKETIINALEKVISGKFDSAFSVSKLQEFLWTNNQPINYNLKEIPRTQDLTPFYSETTGLYVFTKDVFRNLNQRIGETPYLCEVSKFESVDIDYKEDFELAEVVAKHLKIKK